MKKAESSQLSQAQLKMYATEVHTSAVREAHVFDVERLTSFMAQQIPSFVPPLQVCAPNP